MKKVISVILAAVMMACLFPYAVFAYGSQHTYSASGEFSLAEPLQSNVEYIIPSGVTMKVPAGITMYIPANCQLTVKEGGTLDVTGSLVILEGGRLWCAGDIDHSDNVKLDNDGAVAVVQFRFPDLNSNAIRLADKIVVRIAYDDDGVLRETDVPTTGASYDIPLNADVRICAHILEDNEKDASKPLRDKYDDSLLKLKLKNVNLAYVAGYYYKTNQPASVKTVPDTGYFGITATTGGTIGYAKWTNDSDFLTTKKIILPSAEGYECVSRNPVNKTADGVIVVKYGDPFSFRVELDEAYDMSNYEVYINNGYGWLNLNTDADDPESLSFTNIAAKRDEYGYYNIPAVTGDITVTVTGVMKNETITLIGNLIETFRNIFNMLKEFFQSMKDLFGGMNG